MQSQHPIDKIQTDSSYLSSLYQTLEPKNETTTLAPQMSKYSLIMSIRYAKLMVASQAVEFYLPFRSNIDDSLNFANDTLLEGQATRHANELLTKLNR